MAVIISNVATVRESYEKDSAIISTIESNQQILVTDDYPYYYQIIFKNENGEDCKGWVAKRNIELIAPKLESESIE